MKRKCWRCVGLILALVVLLALVPTAPAADDLPAIDFTRETLDNGLRVIYAPLRTAPVVHVRVLYHVGSRDERPDRQGFAHMFEHMMFRGSAHVAPEEHMKLIMQVGGISNAFTSYDQTTYVNTIPANHLEMALWLEADRMASFKVSDEIFTTERKVVSEEWRMRYENQPYGGMYRDFAKTAFTTHSYRWTPIGEMDHLNAAAVGELQEFFNTYYVPNNACLIIVGDIDLEQAKVMVRKYFGWIPRGPELARDIPAEPAQSDSRRLVVHRRSVPLASITMGYKTPAYRNEDHDALALLAAILGHGATSRLDTLLVNSQSPLCRSVGAWSQQLEDPAVLVVNAMAMPGKDPDQIEKIMTDEVARIVQSGVTQEELDKARTAARISIIRSRETAQELARQLGEEEVFGGDAWRVNTEWTRIARLTPADLQAVARKYLLPEHSTVLQYLPDPLGLKTAPATTQAGPQTTAPAASSVPVEPRVAKFPDGYPTKPPMSADIISRPFEKGREMDVAGVKVIVLSDHRLPLVNWTLVMRRGGHATPPGKEGLASLTASMLRRGAADMGYLDLSRDLESRGISIEASDSGDHTRLSGSCTTEQLDHAVLRTKQVLMQPMFPQDEFDKLKRQMVAGLMQSLSNPESVAERELTGALYGDCPLGRQVTMASLGAITLEDVRQWYQTVYRPNEAMLVISGDVNVDSGRKMAETLLADWEPADVLPDVDYSLPPVPSQRRIILVDNPDGKQSAIRMGVRAYSLRSDEKFPGSLASRILSDGIHARLDRYVRAEKGYTYSCNGYFSPNRHAGAFMATVDTRFETTAPAIEAMFEVFGGMSREDVTAEELVEAKTRVAGSMVMEMQTIAQQANRRTDGILNGYPIDYYDVYPQRISQVPAAEVRHVMGKYVRDEAMTIVVVAPAAQVRSQLEQLGTVEVVPMPLKRAATTQPQPEAEPIKKAA